MTAPFIVARFGPELVVLAPDAVLEALFATISYRLEPNGWATRFPVVLDQLHEGRLDPASATAALAEIDRITAELGKVPVDRVVWSMQDLRRRNDAGLPVRRDAPNALEYFIAHDGRPILVCLSDAIRRASMSGQAIVLESGVRHRNILSSVVLTLFGQVVGVVGYEFFPNAIIVPGGTTDAVEHGPLIWVLGFFIAFVGAIGTLGAVFPAFGAWMRARRGLMTVVSVAALGAVGYLAWR